MDDQVLAAMARWPDVPAAYGWLSLDGRGALRLHPGGDSAQGGAGTAITHPGIQQFLRRNYASDAQGAWYVQNGPQRAYVRLDAAPWILRRDDAGTGLLDHAGRALATVQAWWLDEVEGHLYAATDAGAARVDDRDLAALLAGLHGADGQALIDRLEAPLPDAGIVLTAGPGTAADTRIRPLGGRDAASVLGFVRQPAPPVKP